MSRCGKTRADHQEIEERARLVLEHGDRREAVSILMRGYGSDLRAFCHASLPEDGLADDVVQSVFVQAFQDLARFEGRSSFRVWLFAIARHRTLDAARASKRKQRWITAVPELPAVADPDEDPERELSHQCTVTEIWTAARKLPERTLRALEMRFVEGLSFEEMSELTSVRAGTLQARVARALPVLRSQLLALAS